MQQLELNGERIKVLVRDDLGVAVVGRDGRAIWESSRGVAPAAVVRSGEGAARTVPLAGAGDVSVSGFEEGEYRGHTVRLGGIGNADVVVEVVFAINPSADELMVQVEQVGGGDTVVAIEHFYRFEKPVADGGYMILPRGSGYLIPADCPDELPGEGRRNFERDHSYRIGDCWSLPLFGMVRGEDGLCAIAESWWDCEVNGEHIPGEQSSLDFHWRPSLGKLSYPRRLLLRFGEGMDHAAMARAYREHAAKQGLVRTLEEKAEHTPVIRRYIQNILYRLPAWQADQTDPVLADMRRLRSMGFGVNFFFPKWGSKGYSPDRPNTPTTTDAQWHGWLSADPVPGGWPTLSRLMAAARELDAPVQCMIGMTRQTPGCAGYEEERWPTGADGERLTRLLSFHDDLERIRRVLDAMEANAMKPDLLYFDGYSAHGPLPEDFTPGRLVTQRRIYDTQKEVFREVRRRGIMPGAELARFWCMADCDYVFYSDWSSDRLGSKQNLGTPGPVGVPIPLLQLIFHDCHIAGFSGGGYALYLEGVDWWADRTPRLYELLFCAAPAHNWLPDGRVPVHDWESEKTQRRWTWLKRWGAYYRAIATSQMVSHKFLSPDRSKQGIAFANGVTAEFDMPANRFRIQGVEGLTGGWEEPEEL